MSGQEQTKNKENSSQLSDDNNQNSSAKKIKLDSDILTTTEDSIHQLTQYIPSDWLSILDKEFKKPYFIKLSKFVYAERLSKKIYPPTKHTFSFMDCPLSRVKAVIIGQDPYHGPNQAHGMCFSVPRGTRIPPSLQNIYKELERDGFKVPKHGMLSEWCSQGVLLMNATMTVEQGKANSHAKSGWDQFTNAIIKIVNEKCENVVFMLWGAFAQKKASFVNRKKHRVLESVHPSPLSAHRGFIGNGHFSQANTYLTKCGKEPIDWNIISE